MTKLELAAKEYANENPSSYIYKDTDTANAFKAGALYQAEQAKVLEDALDYYANHETIIKEAYTSQSNGQLVCVHSFINHKAIEALKKYRESK